VNYDCTLIDAVYADKGAVIVPFDYASNNWIGLPDDMKRAKNRTEDGRKVWRYTSKETGREFELVWFDYETSTAPDGTRLGSHHFCGMYELSD